MSKVAYRNSWERDKASFVKICELAYLLAPSRRIADTIIDAGEYEYRKSDLQRALSQMMRLMQNGLIFGKWPGVEY